MVSGHLTSFGKNHFSTSSILSVRYLVLSSVQVHLTISSPSCFGHGPSFATRMDDGSQRMYYVGQHGSDTAIGVAKLGLDSKEWVREQSSIVFAEA